MLDPRTKDRMFPKMNTTIFHKLRNLLGYRPVVLNGMLFIVGGKDWISGDMSDGTWRYNPDTGKWNACASMVEPRCRFTADVLDDKIFVTGKIAKQTNFHYKTTTRTSKNQLDFGFCTLIFQPFNHSIHLLILIYTVFKSSLDNQP
jgi:hypothetical protein